MKKKYVLMQIICMRLSPLTTAMHVLNLSVHLLMSVDTPYGYVSMRF